MATEAILHNLSVPTNSDMSANQYKAVNISSTGFCVLSTAAKNIDAVLQNNPASGDTATVAIFGVSKVILSGTVANGALMEVGSSGTFVTIASGTAVAKAMEAGVSGNIITALMLKSNAVYA